MIRPGFTLIELLVVVGIMALLAGLLVAAGTAMGIGSKKEKTAVILGMVRKGVELSVAATASGIEPAEHPLAGSRPPRARFSGIRGRTLVAGSPSGGAVVASLDATQEALSGVGDWQLTSDQDRLLQGDDRFADPALPLLYGLRRDAIGVLAGQLQATTRYLRLPAASSSEILPPPYTTANPRYPAVRCVIAPSGVAAQSSETLERVLGHGGVLGELRALGAVNGTPDDDPAHRILPPTAIAGADNAGRVWSPDVVGGEPQWKPGRVRDGTLPGGEPAWKIYHLRGASLVDAWGREILATSGGNSGLRLQSAGADGVFRWRPAEGALIATPADADAPQGEDRDGARDNIVHEVSE